MVSPLPQPDYVYRARPVRVVDGDTIEAEIDLGLNVTRTERLRLLGVDCPELRGRTAPEGRSARVFTELWLQEADRTLYTRSATWSLVVRTHKADSFGRYLAQVWRVLDGQNLSDQLLAEGLAIPFAGRVPA